MKVGDLVVYTWQEAVEQRIDLDESTLGALLARPSVRSFVLEAQRDRQPLRDPTGLFVGSLVRERRRVEVAPGVLRLTVRIQNDTPVSHCVALSRDGALMHGLVSTHTVLTIRDGAFVSMIDLPETVRELAPTCTNVGCWPVLVGEEETDVLTKNNWLAHRNRNWLAARNIFALNLMSAPGSGKTTLLERTITDLGRELSLSVIEGDQETVNHAERIRATGCRVVQINTGTGCHLDAVMLAGGLEQLAPPSDSVVLIENVGNLVCPALFDLGERSRVVIASVTEGDDKPMKYPHMFRQSDVMILNKIDLLPYVPFNVERCIEYARQLNPRIRIIEVSALHGGGLEKWYDWIRGQCRFAS
jgi:hydrogenase nickel incorporation protein HypB